eukprot:gene1586-2222_t
MAFVVASTTPVPSLHQFGVTAALGVMLVLVFTFLIFIPAVWLNYLRIDRASVDCAPIAMPVLSNSMFQLLTVACFAAFFVYCSMGWSRVVDGVEMSDLTTDGSPLGIFMEKQNMCEAHLGPPVFVVVSGPIDYASAEVSELLTELTANISQTPHIVPTQGQVYSWHKTFSRSYIPFKAHECVPVCAADKYYAYLHKFFDSALGIPYRNDVMLEKDSHGEAMQAARATTDLCRAQLRQLHKRMGHRDYAEIRVFPYSSQYKYYEQFSTSRRDYMIRVGYVLVGITGVTFIFMGMRTTWVVVGLVSLVHLELFGLIHYLGLQLNAISIIMLIATFGAPTTALSS